MVRGMGTYATTGDIGAMLWEIDLDGSNSIGFEEFVKFMCFTFFNATRWGTLEPWNPRTPEPWNPGTLEPWNHRTIEP